MMKDKDARCALMDEISRIAPKVYNRWKSTDLGLPFSTDLFPAAAKPAQKWTKTSAGPLVIHFSNSAARFEEVSNSQISSTLMQSGFQVRFEQLQIQELVKRARKGAFTGLMFGFVPDFVHPHGLISPLMGSAQTYNFGRYSNPEVDRLLNKALSETDRLRQNQIYAQILKLLQSDCAVAFLGSQSGTIYISPYLNTPAIGQLGLHNLRLSTLRQHDPDLGDRK